MKRLKILLADDDLDFQELLQDVVHKNAPHFEVDLVKNGYAAFELIKKKKFDILVTDFEMPVMNGIDLVRSMKSISSVQRPGNIVMLSSYVEEGEADEDVDYVTYINKLDFQKEFSKYIIDKLGDEKCLRKEVPNFEFNYKNKFTRFDISGDDSFSTEVIGDGFVDMLKIQNISYGGICVSGSHFLKNTDSGLEVDLIIGAGANLVMKVKAKVRHLEDSDHFYIGLEFVDMDQDTKKKFKYFIEGLEKAAA